MDEGELEAVEDQRSLPSFSDRLPVLASRIATFQLMVLRCSSSAHSASVVSQRPSDQPTCPQIRPAASRNAIHDARLSGTMSYVSCEDNPAAACFCTAHWYRLCVTSGLDGCQGLRAASSGAIPFGLAINQTSNACFHAASTAILGFASRRTSLSENRTKLRV
jgi:hypothetical protein